VQLQSLRFGRMRQHYEPHSSGLQPFLNESPFNRPQIANFVREFAGRLSSGSDVLDVGAGTAPYREFFDGHRYRTSDWEGSIYEEARSADVVGPIDALPVADSSFDAVLITEVLEHVPNPGAGLCELHRVLRPGGRILLTVPFVWELHEEPYDYFRYTCHGIRYLLLDAGFVNEQIVALTGYYSVVGQLVKNWGSITGVNADSSATRRALALLLSHVGPLLGPFLRSVDRYDHRRGLPIAYAAWAEAPR
jgi:SAM-dependent methyltransferase